MTTAKFFLTATLAFPFSLALRAQPEQPPVPGQIGLSLSGTATSSGQAKLKGGDTTYEHIEIDSSSWAINQRLGLGGARSLTLGLNYNATSIEVRKHHHDTGQLPLPEDLESLGASLKYFQAINQQWMMSASVGAGSHVAETGLLSDGWSASAHAIGIYNHSRQFTFVFGAAYNSLSQDFKVVPVFGCDWRPAEKWSVSFGFPKTGVTYKLNKQLALSLAVSGSGGVYYVKDDPLPGAAPRSLADSKLQFIEARLGFNCDWKINDTFRISGALGQVLYRQFKYIDRDYKLKSSGTVPFVTLASTISL